MDESGVVRFPCAWCGLGVVAPVAAEGRGRCPHCGAVQDVPRPPSPAPEPYALAEAETPVATTAPAPVQPPAATAGRRRRDLWASILHESARRESVLAAEIAALLLLSVADLMTTYHLLRTHPKFYESNPIAQFFFARWNIAGMALFKFSVVAFVIVVGEVVERRRPGLGRFVILTGCLASGVVVFHGLRLAFGEMAWD